MPKIIIKEVRMSKGISLSELAQKIGYSKAYVSYLETGKRTVSFKQAILIARTLNVSTENLYKF